MKPYEAFFHMFFRDRDPGDFPFKFSAEVTNRCNLRCTTCPRQESGRGYGDMDLALFQSLARQAGHRQGLFYPQGFGESFLHPEYGLMLDALNAEGVRYPICITNATYLDEANCRLLVEHAPALVIISLDGGDAETYEQIRVHADYEQVVENIRRLFRVRDELGARRPHISLSVIDNERVRPSVGALRATWEPLMRGSDEIFLCSPISWAGTLLTADTRAPEGAERPLPPPAERPPCRFLYKTLTVFYDGRATPCCYDHRCELEVGNAHEQSIAEIWNGPRMAELRRLHEEGRVDEVPLCRDCPDFIP